MLEKPILQPMWLCPCVLYFPSLRTKAGPPLPRWWLSVGAGQGVHGERVLTGLPLQKVGCDYEIDSNAVEDRCGVCHGDGSTCHTVQKTFEDSEGLGKGTQLHPRPLCSTPRQARCCCLQPGF